MDRYPSEAGALELSPLNPDESMLSALSLPPDATPQERYVFKPRLGSSHYWALSVLDGLVSGQRILDIGAGGGGIGRTIKPLSPSELIAIDLDPHAREALAGTYDEVHETIAPLKGRQFDVILLLDVLEHMVDPFGYLRDLSQYVAPGGRVIVSVPNIAHWSIRLTLCFLGRFEYTSRGILDRTHLQHFNRRRFLSLLSSVTDSSVESTSASIEPVELVLPEYITKSGFLEAVAPLRAGIARTLPTIMAYQHLGVVRKR